MSNNVSHPSHYNAHPAGIECIDVIRHYTCDIANAIKYLWRAGLKPEQGISDRDKEIEDLEKSLFYIDDYRQHPQHSRRHGERDTKTMLRRVRKVTGYTAEQVVSGYPKPIADAMTLLLVVGIIDAGKVYADICWDVCLEQATAAIRARIIAIESALTGKENGTVEAEMTTERNSQPSCIITVGSHYLSLLCAQQQADPDTVLDRMADHLAANVAGMTSRDWYSVRMSDTGQTVQSYLIAHNPDGASTAAALYSEDGKMLRQFRITDSEKKNTEFTDECIQHRIAELQTETVSNDCADIRQYIGKLIVLSYGDFVGRLAFVKGIFHFNDSAEYVDFYFVADSSSMNSRIDSGFTFRLATDIDINRAVIDRCKEVAESDGYKF